MNFLMTEEIARCLVAERCGGDKFDAAGTGYSFSAVLEEEKELEKGNIPGFPNSALLKLSIADPTWRMNMDAIMKALEYFFTNPNATRYTDNRGVIINGKDTNGMLAELLGFPDSNWVQYSFGSIKRALADFIPAAFFGKEDLLIFPEPGYGVIKSRINNRGIQVLSVDMEEQDGGRWRIPLEKIKIPANVRRRFMYINNPHNPTGTACTVEELDNLIQWALKNRVVLIVDEAYIDLVYGSPVSILEIHGWQKCCIVLQSVSKGWNATGLRFGWMIANPLLIRALRKVCDVKDSGLFGLSIVMGLTCLRNPEWMRETRMRYKGLHVLLYDGLRSAGLKSNMPDAGLCQFTPAPRAINGMEFSDLKSCAIMMREKLRISIMHYMVEKKWYLRWATTIETVPACGLETEEKIIKEAARRLKENKFEF